VPFKSARATRSSRPTGLADGLELESTPTRIGESAPRHPANRMRWFPRFRARGRGIRLHRHYYRTKRAILSSQRHKAVRQGYLELAREAGNDARSLVTGRCNLSQRARRTQ
jgi:hypothetical protein